MGGAADRALRIVGHEVDDEGLEMAEPSAGIPKGKQTVLKLYVTAKEAYEKWKAEPEKVMILDVRTPEELLFVGLGRSQGFGGL